MKIKKFKQVGVIGDGAWGSALALVCAENAEKITFFTRSSAAAIIMNRSHINPKNSANIALPKNIWATSHYADLLDLKLLFIAVPTQAFRSCLIEIKHYLSQAIPIIICAKGIENHSLKLMSEICEELIPHNPIAILSGPNFASEIVEKKLSATVVACNDRSMGMNISHLISNSFLRSYYTNDIIGVQVAGATKNVIAIAAGIVVGLALGENAKAALITRGLNEISRLAMSMGGRLETIFGLAGVGDLMLTCGSTTSRNMRCGYMLANNEDIETILSGGCTYEGYFTALSIFQLMKKLDLELPICHAIYRILYEQSDITQEIHKLIHRPLKEETFSGVVERG